MLKSKTVYNGIDRIDDADKYLNGRRVALLTAASGINKSGRPTYEILAEKYNLSVLFAPEHGIRSNFQDGKWANDTRDHETGAAIFNLSSKGCDNIEYALSLCDVVAYDIQDVGARFYTYLYNLTYLMEKCAEFSRPLVIFDRINPIGGLAVQGSWLDESRFSSFIGKYNIPTRYGMTVGEFAFYINKEKHIGCELYVVECSNWERSYFANETDLLWVNPSPNIPSVNAALNYIGSCIFEATNISEGRGTTRPFDLIGAPFINSGKLTDDMNALRLDGVIFRRAFFTPQFNKWSGEMCEGVEVHITDPVMYNPFSTMLKLYKRISEYHNFTCRENSLALRIGTDFLSPIGSNDTEDTSAFILDDYAIDNYIDECEKYCLHFKKKAAKYLFY